MTTPTDPFVKTEASVFAEARAAVVAEVEKLEPAAKAAVAKFAHDVVDALLVKQHAAEAKAAKVQTEAEAAIAAGEAKA
jgi:ABC-type transporter Mla subunit MlaD